MKIKIDENGKEKIVDIKLGPGVTILSIFAIIFGALFFVILGIVFSVWLLVFLIIGGLCSLILLVWYVFYEWNEKRKTKKLFKKYKKEVEQIKRGEIVPASLEDIKAKLKEGESKEVKK